MYELHDLWDNMADSALWAWNKLFILDKAPSVWDFTNNLVSVLKKKRKKTQRWWYCLPTSCVDLKLISMFIHIILKTIWMESIGVMCISEISKNKDNPTKLRICMKVDRIIMCNEVS